MKETWIKFYRLEATVELMAANPRAFILLCQIAFRAQRTDTFNRHNLDVGEAYVGDYKEIGQTEGQYRYAKKYLEKHGFATFKGTSRGTIAKLTKEEE